MKAVICSLVYGAALVSTPLALAAAQRPETAAVRQLARSAHRGAHPEGCEPQEGRHQSGRVERRRHADGHGGEQGAQHARRDARPRQGR